MALSTVSLWLKKIGLGKRSGLEPEPPSRYERRRPGELIHVDVKQLGRILKPGHRVTGSRRGQAKTHRAGKSVSLAGWEFVHVAVDDHSRLANAEVLSDETAKTAIAFCGERLPWLLHYNFKRPHGALRHQGPATRLNNLVGNYS
jgi:hypothetical protein